MKQRRRWLPWVTATLGLAFGVTIGGIVFSFEPWEGPRAKAASDRSTDAQAAQPDGEDAGGSANQPPSIPVQGKVKTSVSDFSLADAAGKKVLQIQKLEADVELAALRDSRLRMPTGTARGIRILLRKNEQGRVSLADAMRPGGSSPGSSSGGMLLDIGPLEARDIRLEIGMAATPVIIQVSRARLRVRRAKHAAAPQIYLSDIEGKLVSPQPLPDPIEIHDGEGTVDLAADPLVDLRTQVCLRNGEMRLQIRVPERQPQTTTLIVDGEGLLGLTARGAMHVVGWFKDSLDVQRGKVEVPGAKPCKSD